MKTLYTAAALFLFAGAAHACPNMNMDGYTINAYGSQLYSAQSYQVVAGGGNDLNYCGQPGYGYVTTAPDFNLYYTQDGGYQLTFRLNTNCDSILLIADPFGNWYFDDDSNGNLDAAINVGNGNDGLYSIWVGTIGPNSCDATLTMETF